MEAPLQYLGTATHRLVAGIGQDRAASKPLFARAGKKLVERPQLYVRFGALLSPLGNKTAIRKRKNSTCRGSLGQQFFDRRVNLA